MSENLILLAGIPGAGKSTFARNFFEETFLANYKIVSSDRIRKGIFGDLKAAHSPETKKENNALVFSTFHDEIAKLLKGRWNVVADATFLTRSSRDKVREIGERYGAKVHVILFKNLDEADYRNKQRDEEEVVPEEAMDFMRTKFYDTLSELPQETYTTVTKIESFV